MEEIKAKIKFYKKDLKIKQPLSVPSPVREELG
jgi:hypothetical protein